MVSTQTPSQFSLRTALRVSPKRCLDKETTVIVLCNNYTYYDITSCDSLMISEILTLSVFCARAIHRSTGGMSVYPCMVAQHVTQEIFVTHIVCHVKMHHLTPLVDAIRQHAKGKLRFTPYPRLSNGLPIRISKNIPMLKTAY